MTDGAAGPLKMYILIPDSIPTGFAVLAAAHASLKAYLEFQATEEAREWIAGRFYKCVCKVTAEEFVRAKSVDDHVVLTESALRDPDGVPKEVAIAFKPRRAWPKAFRFYRLYS